ncbi:tetratricopeptide repeat protein [Marinospirillum perlucidum]|uniref:tetratricopeptide repeat protein n=1 Tax=Marinospirillum perlucidum TaxID=1982602 RepID=UPI00138FF3D7|nr:tetratricopeptide repeat protein [Marinospirillum perlucidum]
MHSLFVKGLVILVFLLGIAPLSLQAAGVVSEMQRLNAEQEYQEAFLLGSRYLDSKAGDPEFDQAFGRAALKSGQLYQALFAFERILIVNPQASAPRMELAQTHLELQNWSLAREHFRQLLEADPPPSPRMLESIRRYLVELDLREQEEATLVRSSTTNRYLGWNLGYDSNVGALTSDNEALQQSPQASNEVLPDPESDYFSNLYAGVKHYQVTTGERGFFLAAEVNRKLHRQKSSFNETGLELTLAPVFFTGGGRLVFPASFQRSSRNDGNDLTRLALGVNYRKPVEETTSLLVMGRMNRVDYGGTGERDLRGRLVGMKMEFQLATRWQLRLGPLWGRTQAETGGYEYLGRDYLEFSSRISYRVAEDLGGSLALATTRSNYQEEHWAFARTRQDELQRLSLAGHYKPWNAWELEVKLEQLNNASNIDFYAYRRTQLWVGIQRGF